MSENENLRFSDETADAIRRIRLLDNIRAVQGDILAKEFNADIEEMADAMMRRRQQRQEIEAKAAAMDRTLAAWGMTWEQYQTRRTETTVLPASEHMRPMGTDTIAKFTAADYLQSGTDAPDTGREPNEHSEETRFNTGEGSQTR